MNKYFFSLSISVFLITSGYTQTLIQTNVEPVQINVRDLAKYETVNPAKKTLLHSLDSYNNTIEESPLKDSYKYIRKNSSNISPAPDTIFLGSELTYNPQDPMGAVGMDHVLTSDNAVVRVHDKSGNILSSLSSSAFWSSASPSGTVADPWAAYDKIADRWVLIASAFKSNGFVDLMIAVSQTNDPEGNWFLYKMEDKGAHVMNFGLNKKWVAINVGLVFEKSILYSGGMLSYFDIGGGLGRIAMQVDTIEEDLYIMNYVNHWYNGVNYSCAVYKIHGSSSSPTVMFVGGLSTSEVPKLSGYQAPVLVNNKIWIAGATGCGSFAQNCSSLVWYQIDLNGFILVHVDTIELTGSVYNTPSIAVNKNDDAIIGYNIKEPGGFNSAAYSLRYGTDPLGVTRDMFVYKQGLNRCSPWRWGDYSISCTDPDGYSLWTLQQAATPNSPCDNSFWAKVKLCPNNLNLSGVIDSSSQRYEVNQFIRSTRKIKGNSDITYDAKDSIVLYPFFELDLGSLFQALMDGCGNN